ncbi:hypothetical protein PGN35_024635 [Nodosilinea sp. PGN35]|uniref:hypothetical protein n=1 Tax=Nodosilinea sp. PGN35 TaxID=3020489 RepID=UPI0023B2B3D9|nr:hypothetical protein [Nodosilinea sp. TSF1-S3]MDF0370202.1 hypothetical protein [Nodosilinea sp. TSF1-S3]
MAIPLYSKGFILVTGVWLGTDDNTPAPGGSGRRCRRGHWSDRRSGLAELEIGRDRRFVVFP